MPSYEELFQANSELLRRVDELVRTVEQQQRLMERQQHEIERLQRRIAELEKLIEELRRRGKRQAAPFSKGEPKASPTTPGRKAGQQYGRTSQRPVPQHIDETVEVPCPLWCPACEGAVRLVGKAHQYQIDVPQVQSWTTDFVVHYGQCRVCGRRVQGRHVRQISDALGVGRVQWGPGIVAWAAYLNKVGGLSYDKIAAILREMVGLKVSPASLCRALRRLTKKAEPTYGGLVNAVRGSPVVYPDETGWRVGGHSAWLWAFTNQWQTVYAIEPGRGFAQAASILGQDYPGVIGVDGWAPYRQFEQAQVQTCLAHLLRRSREMEETAVGGAVRFPRAVAEVLHTALELRDRWQAGEISRHGLRIARGRLEARLDRLLSKKYTNAANARLARHLIRSRQELFLFLERDDVEATNWPAEHAIRPAVVNRKSCGGNRTQEGARSQAVLMSVMRTCHQQQISPLTVCRDILRDPEKRAHSSLLAPPPAR
jgi:transposase